MVGDLAEAAQAEYLEPAGIGEDGVGPGHEAVQSAHLANGFVPRAKEKMVGVGQQDGDVEVFGKVALGQAFNGGLGSDGHENRGLDGAVRGVKQAGTGARPGALCHHFESDLPQVFSLARKGGVSYAPV